MLPFGIAMQQAHKVKPNLVKGRNFHIRKYTKPFYTKFHISIIQVSFDTKHDSMIFDLDTN